MGLELRQSAHVVQLGIMGPDVIGHGLRRNDDDGEQAAHVLLETAHNLTMQRTFLI